MRHILDASFRYRFFEAVDAELAISEMGCLERLDLSYNKIERPPRLPASLISLNLSYNPQCQNLAGLAVSSLMNLRELVMTNNTLTSTHGLSHLTNLEVLNLSDNSIKKLSGLEMLGRLKVLILVHNNINNVIALRCLSCNELLERLDLRGNPVCDSQNYATVRNMMGEYLREMDGRIIKAKRFPTNKAAHSSTVSDNTYLYYAKEKCGTVPPNSASRDTTNSSLSMCAKYTSIEDRASPEKFRVLRRHSFKTTREEVNGRKHEASVRHVGIAPVPRAHTCSSSAGTVSLAPGLTLGFQGTASVKGEGGYSAQYLAHDVKYSGLLPHDSGKRISVAGGLHMKTQYHHHHQGNKGTNSPETEQDGSVGARTTPRSEDYWFNGDGSPRGKAQRRRGTANATRSNDSTASTDVGLHFAHSHTSFYQNTTGPEGASYLVKEIHIQRKSTVPWRNAPKVKPRPWKGVFVYDSPEKCSYDNTTNEGGFGVGNGTDEWVPVISQKGRHMVNSKEWVSPVTVAAYERDRCNVSNKNVYRVIKEGMPVPFKPPHVRGPENSITHNSHASETGRESPRGGSGGTVGGGRAKHGNRYYSAASIVPAWANRPGEDKGCAFGSPSSLEYSLNRSMDKDKSQMNEDKYQYLEVDANELPLSYSSISRNHGHGTGESPTRGELPYSTESHQSPRNMGSSSEYGTIVGRDSTYKRGARHYEEATFSTFTKTSPARQKYLHAAPPLPVSPNEISTVIGTKSEERNMHLSALERLALSDDPGGATDFDQYTYTVQGDDEKRRQRTVQDVSVCFVSTSNHEGTNTITGTPGRSTVDLSALSVDTADIYVSKIFPPAAPAY